MESQTRQWSTDAIEECLAQRRCTENDWGGRNVKCIIGVPVVIEELPSWAEEGGKGCLECGKASRGTEWRN
jgi:hypothetical protein